MDSLDQILALQPEILLIDQQLELILDKISFLELIQKVINYPFLYDNLNSTNKQQFWKEYYFKKYPHINQADVTNWFQQCCIQNNFYSSYRPLNFDVTTRKLYYQYLLPNYQKERSELNLQVEKEQSTPSTKDFAGYRGHISRNFLYSFRFQNIKQICAQLDLCILYEDNNLYHYYVKDDKLVEKLVLSNVSKIVSMILFDMLDPNNPNIILTITIAIAILTKDNILYFYFDEENHLNSQLQKFHLFPVLDIKDFSNYFPGIKLIENMEHQLYELNADSISATEDETNISFNGGMDLQTDILDGWGSTVMSYDIFYVGADIHIIFYVDNQNKILMNIFGRGYNFTLNMSEINKEINSLKINKVFILTRRKEEKLSYNKTVKTRDILQIYHQTGISWMNIFDLFKIVFKNVYDSNPTSETVLIEQLKQSISKHNPVIIKSPDGTKVKDVFYLYDFQSKYTYIYMLDIKGRLYFNKFMESTPPDIMAWKETSGDQTKYKKIADNVNKFLILDRNDKNDVSNSWLAEIDVNHYVFVPYEHYLLFILNQQVTKDFVTENQIIFQIVDNDKTFKTYKK